MSSTINSIFAFAAFIVFISISSSNVSANHNETVIDLVIYYESLCKDSIKFITTQLAPNYKEFSSFLNVKLIPFGKASWVIDENNQPQFKCQHGPDECKGNRAQSCALHEIEQIEDPKRQQEMAVEFVNCVMSKKHPPNAVYRCTTNLGLEVEAVDRIVHCSKSEIGNNLLIANGEKTNAFEFPLKFVPTIVINGQKNSEAFKNFRSVICDYIPLNKKPATCSSTSCPPGDPKCPRKSIRLEIKIQLQRTRRGGLLSKL